MQFFTTHGLNYSAVCGRLRGYQFGRAGAFFQYIVGVRNNATPSIDDAYVDGVSITHGSSPRKHIWTYAIGASDDSIFADCPCNTDSTQSIPPYVGDKYYCESGTDSPSAGALNPLWDGMDCNSPCCSNSTLPWFNTTLSETTNDDLELRLLFTRTRNMKGGPLDLIELYIR